MRDEALNLLARLTEAHGAPGHEDEVRAIFCDELKGAGRFSSDRLGCVMCEGTANQKVPRVMLTAHMDEVGFLVQTITESGFLKIVPLGGWWTQTLLAHRVRVKTHIGREVRGVIASTPPHFLSEADRNKVLTIEQLSIDIGASSRAQAEDEFAVRPGDPIVPDVTMTRLADRHLLMGKAFDNRAGLGVVIQAFRQLAGTEHLPNTVSAVGTVQEEIGCRGAMTAATLARPDVALILEGTPADDTPGCGSDGSQGAIGKGPQIRVMDPSALMNRRLVDFVCDVAAEKSIPFQVAVRRGGGTDARSFQVAHLGAPCVVIGVPARYIHSHNSIIDINDYLATLTLVVEVTRRLDAATAAELVSYLPAD
ncbi:MAG: M42 family metallopeptidase [Verrucomicrobiales bacterium]